MRGEKAGRKAVALIRKKNLNHLSQVPTNLVELLHAVRQTTTNWLKSKQGRKEVSS